MKDYIIRSIIIVILLWVAITTGIYRFTNIEKSDTEVFLHIPKSMIFIDI